MKLIDVKTGRAVFSLDEADGFVRDATISPDGKTFLWATEKNLYVLDVPSRQQRAPVPLPPLLKLDGLSISPDGGTLVTAGQHLMIFWDLASLKPRRSVLIDNIFGGRAVFTADSRRAAIPFREKVVLFDTRNGQALGAVTAERPQRVPLWISLSGDGSLLATVQTDGKTTGVHLFDLQQLDPPPAVRDADSSALESRDPLATTPDATQTKPSPTDPTVFVGAWHSLNGGLGETWKIARDGNTWKVSATYFKSTAEAGAAHGDNVTFANGVLTFTRVFDRKPIRSFTNDAVITLEFKDGHLNFTATAGKKTQHLILQNEAGK